MPLRSLQRGVAPSACAPPLPSTHGRNGITLGALAALAIAALAVPPHHWRAPHPFYEHALCIHRYESGDFHYGPTRHPRGAWNGYFNGWQFTLGTWQRADRLLGRHDDPQWSPPWVQLMHVWAIWRDDAYSFREWPRSSKLCGLA